VGGRPAFDRLAHLHDSGFHNPGLHDHDFDDYDLGDYDDDPDDDYDVDQPVAASTSSAVPAPSGDAAP
jgi:hypothetical protein